MPDFSNIRNSIIKKASFVKAKIFAWLNKISPFKLPSGQAWPSKYQWGRFPSILSCWEKRLLGIFVLFIIIGLFFPIKSWYINRTEIAPDYGGSYTEAALGLPRYINPVLSVANDVDRDLTAILFSSLIKQGGENKIILDLAENFTVSEDGKSYDFTMRQDVKWHDGKPLNADDIVFTVQLIQNPDYKSPLRANLQGSEIEKTGDYSVRFVLKSPYAPFLENLTFGILPKHIWENITPANFPLTEINLKPIGSGPYKFSSLEKDSDGNVELIELTAFSKYYLKKPFIDSITFRFYKTEDAAIGAFASGQAQGISFISANKLEKIKNLNPILNKIILPRYFAVFFNQTENKALEDINARKALTTAIDKNEIVEKMLGGQAIAVNSPVPEFILSDDFEASKANTTTAAFNPDEAANILNAAGWNATSTPEVATTTVLRRFKTINKEAVPLRVSLSTVNWPELEEVGNYIKTSWEKIGVEVDFQISSVAEIQDKIKNRQYEGLLFGQILGANPDPFAFWHSSQKKDPGLNLSLYENKDADKILENIRKETNQEIKMNLYRQLKEAINKDAPAIFLYSPVYVFPASKNIKGIDLRNTHFPSARFSQIENWYIETQREWK